MADKSGERSTNGVSTGDMSAWKQLYEQFQKSERPEGSITSDDFAKMIGKGRVRANTILLQLVQEGKATRHQYTPTRGGTAYYYVVADRG